MPKPLVLGSAFACALTVTASSLGRERDASSSEPTSSLSLRTTAGAFVDSEHKGSAGVLLGAELLVRHGWLVTGASTRISNLILSYSDVSVGPTVGMALPLLPWVRVELLGVGGGRHYKGVGSGLFSRDPGASGSLPFLGLRTHASLELGGPTARLSLGLGSFIETDVGHLSKTYTYQESAWFTDELYPTTATHRIGLARAGLTLSLGGTFGL